MYAAATSPGAPFIPMPSPLSLRPRPRSRAFPAKGLGATDQQLTQMFGQIGSMIPVAGPFIAAAANIAIQIENAFSGCGVTCVQATNIAEVIGGPLTQNVNNYLSQPKHYYSMQQAALYIFDSTWQRLVTACGNQQLGQAGVHCITDRQAGACKWKASPGGWRQDLSQPSGWNYFGWGGAGSGDACWNWFTGMRDPIANDPTVLPDPEEADASLNSFFGGIPSGSLPPAISNFFGGGSLGGIPLSYLAIGGGALLLALMIPGGD